MLLQKTKIYIFDNKERFGLETVQKYRIFVSLLSRNRMIQYIENEAHYNDVISLAEKVKHSLWIGTADIKDIYVKRKTRTSPFLEVLDELIKRGVCVRLIHAKEPGVNFRTDFDKYPALWNNLERVLCPRVHFKLMIFDLETAYIGSANLTGAGLGMKGVNNRNFEAGLLTNEPAIVDRAINQFDTLWIGKHCKACKRKIYCNDQIK